MSQALRELSIRLDELRNDLKLLEYAFELRPRIHQVLNHESRGEVLDLARRFGSVVQNGPEAFYGPMLVRLVASLERYLRLLMAELVEIWAKNAKSYDQLPPGLKERNLVLSGKFIGESDSPRDHLRSIELITLVDNLATCRSGAIGFKLNSPVFMNLITGVTADVIEKSLSKTQVNSWWNAVGADATLKSQLNVRRTVDTQKEAEKKLKELSRWRNNWAHGGDDEVALTRENLGSALEFVSAFSCALDAVALKQVNSKAAKS